MNPQEKKYRVDSFNNIVVALSAVGAKKIRDITSVHYYGVHDGNDVEKFVVYPDRCEIHRLKESGGKFTLIEHKTIEDADAGFKWLLSRGYKTANVVNLEYAEYAYRDGTVGLYVVDNFLHSVILYFLPNQLEAAETVFGLQNAEVITVPYNKYLGIMGKLRSVPVSA